ncbi:MAG: crotonobetainyl-CoA--carnitine CoA-transferase [Oscillospiraceae bacterium]|nr:crotonobetainyl-CoA--carnitine CoA-transferase [Oscillospiraceae bacterium]
MIESLKASSKENSQKILLGSTKAELDKREDFLTKVFAKGLPTNEVLNNLGLYISRQNLSRILYMHELYQKIINVHGCVVEFGVRWGQNMALFENFRGIYEPFNHNRKVIGFDTFEGLASLDEKDGNSEIMSNGAYSVTEGYDQILSQILDYYESESPISHTKKYELVRGDATVTAKEYFETNPHIIIALAYFDFDIYRPTYECLKIIKERVTKGSIIAFDEINAKEFPGETLALREVFALDDYAIRRAPYNPLTSYLVIE